MNAEGWTDDRVESLKRLYEAGLSASQIAAELGYITRNAVIGKVTRLGLTKRGRASAKPRERRISVNRTVYIDRPVTRIARALAKTAAAIDETAPEAVGYDISIPIDQRASLAGLTDANCHWPVGDPVSPDFYFCGGKALTGFPYCAHHARVAYEPASSRRRKPTPNSSAETRSGAWC